MRHSIAWLAVLTAVLASSRSADAAITQPGFTETQWGSTTGDLDGIAWAPDGSGRLFTIHKGGAVRITKLMPAGTSMLVPTPFATITPIYTGSECGLIGMAFDPDFTTNHYVYFFVTVSSSQQQIIRYTANGDVGMDKTVIVPGLPTAGANHDGGAVAIGMDGKLYWSVGDQGGGTGVDADLTSLASKVGRANRDGSKPTDNPFDDGAGPNNDFIWARGFRNPFTMTFQPSTGALWLNVVGSGYEQAFVVARGDHGGWNDFENNQPANYIVPAIKYRTGDLEEFTLAAAPMGAVRSGGVVTFRTTNRHGLRKGEKVTITGVTDTSFNGAFYVDTVAILPATNTFTVVQAGADATSGAGRVQTLDQGNVIAGGTFYEGTAFPPEYRGNFFYTDFGSGRVQRAVVGTGTTLTQVDHWATVPTAIDAAVGPDGNLYVGSYGGNLFRYSYDPGTTQALVVSKRYVDWSEGNDATFEVRLAVAPTADVTVAVARSAGSTGISVQSGASLTFTAASFRVPQVVTLRAVADADGTSEQATFTVSSAGLTSVPVTARVLDAAGPLVLPDGGLGGEDAAVGDAGASADGSVTPGDDDDGCGCRTGRAPEGRGAVAVGLALLGLGLLLARGRRAR